MQSITGKISHKSLQSGTKVNNYSSTADSSAVAGTASTYRQQAQLQTLSPDLSALHFVLSYFWCPFGDSAKLSLLFGLCSGSEQGTDAESAWSG